MPYVIDNEPRAGRKQRLSIGFNKLFDATRGFEVDRILREHLDGYELRSEWFGLFTEVELVAPPNADAARIVTDLRRALDVVAATFPSLERLAFPEKRPRRPKVPELNLEETHEAVAARPAPPSWVASRDVFEYLPLAAERAVTIERYPTWRAVLHAKDEPSRSIELGGGAVRQSKPALAPDGRRIAIPLKRDVVIADTATWTEVGRIAVPRTPRDNNGWTSVAFLDDALLLVATETGLYVLDSHGEQRSFVRCLDILELAITADRQRVLVHRSDGPVRLELYAVDGERLTLIGTAGKSGTPVARGNDLFAVLSPRKVARIA